MCVAIAGAARVSPPALVAEGGSGRGRGRSGSLRRPPAAPNGRPAAAPITRSSAGRGARHRRRLRQRRRARPSTARWTSLVETRQFLNSRCSHRQRTCSPNAPRRSEERAGTRHRVGDGRLRLRPRRRGADGGVESRYRPIAGVVEAWEAAASWCVRRAFALGSTCAPRTVLPRSGGLLGRMLLPCPLGAGGRIGSGRQWWSWILLEDAVAGYLSRSRAASRGRSQLSPP